MNAIVEQSSPLVGVSRLGRAGAHRLPELRFGVGLSVRGGRMTRSPSKGMKHAAIVVLAVGLSAGLGACGSSSSQPAPTTTLSVVTTTFAPVSLAPVTTTTLSVVTTTFAPVSLAPVTTTFNMCDAGMVLLPGPNGTMTCQIPEPTGPTTTVAPPTTCPAGWHILTNGDIAMGDVGQCAPDVGDQDG